MASTSHAPELRRPAKITLILAFSLMEKELEGKA
jgi:hypothetical protein